MRIIEPKKKRKKPIGISQDDLARARKAVPSDWSYRNSFKMSIYPSGMGYYTPKRKDEGFVA